MIYLLSLNLMGNKSLVLENFQLDQLLFALGTTFFLESSNSVKAAEQTNATTNQNTSNKDTNFDTNKLRTLNIQQNKPETDTKQSPDVSEKNNVVADKLNSTQDNNE